MGDNWLFDGEGIDLHHLQGLGLQKSAAETRRLLQEQERQRKGVCSCPHCGGGIPKVGVSVCMHCRGKLVWFNGHCGATAEQATKNCDISQRQAQNQQQKRRLESQAGAALIPYFFSCLCFFGCCLTFIITAATWRWYFFLLLGLPICIGLWRGGRTLYKVSKEIADAPAPPGWA